MLLAIDFEGRFFGLTADLDPLGQRLWLLDTRLTLGNTLDEQLCVILLRLTGSFLRDRLVGHSLLGGDGAGRLFILRWQILIILHFPIYNEEVGL